MRKIAIACSGILCLAIVLLLYLLYEPTPNPGTTGNAVLEKRESQKFTKSEIQAAMDCVLAKFSDFGGCDMTKLWYDESALEASDIDQDDVNHMKLLCDFSTDHTAGSGGFNTNFEYTRWIWSLERDDPQSEWTIKDWGYG